ncbi:MAG: hypothetical protein PVF40_00660 [Ectothiorhodospiraceae bacterium]|jgi:hypothetical protein
MTVDQAPKRILLEMLSRLRRAWLTALLLPLLAVLLICWLADWALVALAPVAGPAAAAGLALWCLGAGFAAVSQLCGLTVFALGQQRLDRGILLLRSLRTGAVEFTAIAAAALVVAVLDATFGATLSRLAENWANVRLAAPLVTAPGPEVGAGVACCGILRFISASWLWPALSAAYPKARLSAVYRLAAGATRGTPWLEHTFLASLAAIVALLVLSPQWGLAGLVLIPAWPALAAVSAERIAARSGPVTGAGSAWPRRGPPA